MIVNSQNTYSGVRVRIDNQTFEGCIFQNCIIEYAAEGPISLSGCSFNECQWVFVGSAQNTLNFMQVMYHGMGEFGQQMIEATFNNIKEGGIPTETSPNKQSQSDA